MKKIRDYLPDYLETCFKCKKVFSLWDYSHNNHFKHLAMVVGDSDNTIQIIVWTYGILNCVFTSHYGLCRQRNPKVTGSNPFILLSLHNSVDYVTDYTVLSG